MYLFLKYNLKISPWLLCTIILAAAYLVVAHYLKYVTLHFYVDFAHWAEIFYNIASKGKPWSFSQELLVPGARNYFSVHFVPLIYALALPYKIWPYNTTIIILNFLLMISAAVPMYKLSLAFRRDKLFALFMTVLLLWYPSFQYISLYEFEMLRFCIPILLWMLYFWKKKKMVGYYLFVIMAVLVREEVGLTIMMFGTYLIFCEKRYRCGLITASIGMGAFIIITEMVMPALRSNESYEHIAQILFHSFGTTPYDVIKNVILNPSLTFNTIFQVIKLANVFMFFIPLCFVPLLSPTILISTFANFGVCLLVDGNTRISYMLYYMAPSIPFIFYAFITAWPKVLMLVENTFKPLFNTGDTVAIHSAAMAMVLSGLLIANVFFGLSPVSLQFWFKDLRPAPFDTQNHHHSVFKITDHHRIVDEFVKLIPDSASVSAPYYLHPRLSKKGGTIIFPKYENAEHNDKADYVFFDKTNNGHKPTSTVYRKQVDFDAIEKDTLTWKMIKSKDGYFLYKRIEN
jgi:uncharacterized membrane protein